MDFTPEKLDIPSKPQLSKSIILACMSQKYFSTYLQTTHTTPLLTTTGLMAPEAYTLESALSTWYTTESEEQTHLAAATTYARFQKANLAWSKRLFYSAVVPDDQRELSPHPK